jgi:signal transduction histidine kinase
MNIYAVPMLIAGVLCTVLSIITWLYRRREKINRVFSFFTLALAADSYAFFAWFQFGRVEDIHTWVRFNFTLGFLVPITLILFFFAFSGYDKRTNDRVLRIKARHFKFVSLLFIVTLMCLVQFTELVIDIADEPEHIWDIRFGTIGQYLFGAFSVIFVYLFAMAFKAYRMTDNEPQKKFIFLLSVGTLVWLLFGYIGAFVFPTESQPWHATSYIGTTLMAIFYFVAIINYQSDKVYELNVNLERKVEDRTQELKEKNTELEDALDKLTHMQQQIILQEKMASLGQLVAGLTHEFNTPIGAIRSMNSTKSKAVMKLQTALDEIVPDATRKNHEIGNAVAVILEADQLIDEGTERLNEIITNLKNFTKLDEAELALADIHEGLDSVLALMSRDRLKDIDVVREYGQIRPFVFSARKLNQVFLNLIRNACQAIEGKGQITITTSLKNNEVYVAIRDTGKGIDPDDLESIFDPGFSTKGSVVRASLGLSICHQIVQEHNGKIDVESQPGKGSIFTVILPTDL